MKSKQHDLMLNVLANPQASIEDFLKAGLSAANTSLEDEKTYLSSDEITSNPLFHDKSGEFDKVKFHNIYLQLERGLEQMSSEPQDFKAVYSKYNIWAPISLRENEPTFSLTKVTNPDRITKSMIRVGQDGPRELTPQEIAQSQKIWDTEKLKWMDTPEDMFSFNKLFNDFAGFFSDNFGSTKVMATYDTDIDINGRKRGEIGFDESNIEHYKGEYKLNENGTYYYRTLKDGENIYGKLTLHFSDILTREGSALNSVDFLDSDDILKTGFGAFVKNASLIGAMFLPYVGPAIAGATIFQLAAGLGATLGKIALQDSNNSTLNWIEGLVESTNPLNTRSEWSTIDYGNTGRNTTWTIENLLGMAADVVGLLKQQRLIFEYSPFLTKGKWGMLDPKKLRVLEESYLKELQMASKGQVLSKLETNPLKAIEASKKLEAVNIKKASDMVQDYMKSYYKSGEELSKAYMTLLTVNDIYAEALEAGADEFDASVITMGYAAMEYALLSTDIGKWVLPELRGERLQNKAMLHALTKETREGFRQLRKAATASDEAKKTYLLKLVDFGKSVCKGEFNVGLGKRAAFQEGKGLLKAGIGSLFAGASAEAIEETSEELLGDISRVLFNGLEQLQGKDVRLKPFENVFDRYAMSFLGGFIGGGVSSATFDFSNARRALNMNYNQAMQELIHKAHNNDLEGVYKLLDKETIGNKNLSAKHFDKDENGNIIWKQGDENDNLDLAIKNIVRRQLLLILDTLDAHGGKTDDEFLDIQTIRDLRFRALRNTTTAGLFIQKYNENLTELVKLTQELHDLNTPSAKAENGEKDLKDGKSEELEAKRKIIQDKIKVIDEKLEEFHSGAKAPLFMATALIESTPFISLALMPSTFRVFAEYKSGKQFEELSESELKDLLTKYDMYLRTDKKDDLLLATKSYLIMAALQKENLELVQELLKKLSKDPIISEMLGNISENFGILNFEQDTEKWQESFGKFAESVTGLEEEILNEVNSLYNNYQENLRNNSKTKELIEADLATFIPERIEEELLQKIEEANNIRLKKIKDAEDILNSLGELSRNSAENISLYETTVNEANKEFEEIKLLLQQQAREKETVGKLKYIDDLSKKGIDINNLDKQKEEADKQNREQLEKELLNLIFKTGVQLVNLLADTIISQGFINGAIKDQVIDKLSSMSKILEQTGRQAEDLVSSELKSKGVEVLDLKSLIDLGSIEDAESIFEKENVDALILVRELYLIPKLEIDSKIEQIKNLDYTPIMQNLDAFAVNIGKRRVSLVFSDLEKIISSTRQNISQFTLSGDLHKQIGEAERILNLYIATLEGARIDTADPFGINITETGLVEDKANVWGINRVINEVHAKSPKIENEQWEDLPEIEGEIADMMIEDAKRLKNLLYTYKKLYAINQGLKLNVQKRVSTKTHYLLYDKLKRLITNCDLPNKEFLELKLNSLTFLKELTQDVDNSKWIINLSKELEKLLERERIELEDAIFEYFLDKLNDIEALKQIFNPKNFVMNTDKESLLSEGSKNIDDSSFIGYLAAKAALKTSALLGKLKELFKGGNIAPLIGQEISVQLGLANILNGLAITNIIRAYRSSLLEMSIEERKNFFKNYPDEIKRIMGTEAGIKFFINHDLVPLYDNIIFIDGIPGAGKSAAVDALIYNYLKAYHTDLSSKIWVSHGGDTEGGKITKQFSLDIGFGDSFENTFDKIQLLKNIFEDYVPKPLNRYGKYSYTSEDYIIDVNGLIQVKWKINGKWTQDNVPKVIFIDEAQLFSQIELLALDKFAKKFGISIIMSGDLDLSQMHADINLNEIIEEINKELKDSGVEKKDLLPLAGEIEIDKTTGKPKLDSNNKPLKKDNPYSGHLSRNQVLHTFKIGTSMRTSNNLKNTNMANTRVVMGNGSGTLELHYYEDEKTLAGEFQLKTADVNDIKVWLDKMIPLLKEGDKIHVAIPEEDPIKSLLESIEKYNKVILFHKGVALGLEGDFWIVKFSNVDDDNFKQDFYTGQTRSRKFTLMLVPDTVQNKQIKIINILDLESHPEEYSKATIKRYSDEHVKLLEDILPKKLDNIEYNPRTPESEKPIEHSTGKPEKTSTDSEKEDKRKRMLEAIEGRFHFSEEKTEEPEVRDLEYYKNEIKNAITPQLVNDIFTEATTVGGINESDIIDDYNRRQLELDPNNPLKKDIDYYLTKINEISSLDKLNDFHEDFKSNMNLSNEEDIVIEEAFLLKLQELDPTHIDSEENNEEVVLEDSNIFKNDEEPSPDEISELEDLQIEEMKDKLDEINGVITKSDSQKQEVSPEVSGLDIQGFKYNLYSNSTFELGTAIKKEDGTYEIEMLYDNYRIDGVNGIEQGVKQGVITDFEWKEILRTKQIKRADGKLGYIRRLLMSLNLSKALITKLIAQDMGLSGGVYIRFAIKTSSGDINFDSDAYKKLEKNPKEALSYARATRRKNAESNKVNLRRLVAIIGTNGKDVIELPLLLLNNPITIIKEQLDENHEIRNLYDYIHDSTKGPWQKKQIEALKAVENFTGNKKEYESFHDLVLLYLTTYRHILFIPDQNWTPASGLEGLGLLLYQERGVEDYENIDYIQTRDYNNLDELRADPALHWITKPRHLNNKDGIIYNEDETESVRIANPKHPFVLYTDLTHDHNGQPITSDLDVINEFLWQLFHDVPKTVQIVYILPPTFKFEDYMTRLAEFMVNEGPAPYGNQRTPYKILEALFIGDAENNHENLLKCFLNALGNEDGEILFRKTASIISELSQYTTSDGKIDISKQVKELTTRTEAWNLGNVGIPKEIPLYKQLQNVLKQLIHPQSVAMEYNSETGWSMYISRKGVDRSEELLNPLINIFNKSNTILYHQTVASKTSEESIFIEIQTDNLGHFITGEDFLVNGNITSQEFGSNSSFNKMIHNLVSSIRVDGTMVRTSDNIPYIKGTSGWNTPDTNISLNVSLSNIDLKIKNKLKRFGYSEKFIDSLEELITQSTKLSTDKIALLYEIANILNSLDSNNIRAIVFNGELLLGQNNLFVNKRVMFGSGHLTSRGFEMEVNIGGVPYDGTLINGELFLSTQVISNDNLSQEPVEINYVEAAKTAINELANWPGNFTERKRKAVTNRLIDYINTPTPEKLLELLDDEKVKNVLNTFGNTSETNNLEESSDNCSIEFKIKFN